MWVYEKKPGVNPRPDKASRISVETHYYSIQLDDGTWDTGLDDWITRIEGNAVAGLKTLLAKQMPTGNDRKHVAQWLGVTYTRTRGMRRIMAATMAAVEQAEDYALAADHHKFAEWIALQEALLGVEFVEEEKQHIRTQMLEPGITPVKITKARLLDMWDLMAKLVPTIESMKWTVVEAISGSHFITGDAPLLPGQPTPTKDGELSFHRRTAYITLPLSPSLMLLMTHVHQMPDYRSDYEANLVEQQNLFRVKAAEQHVFGDRNEPSIQSLVTEYENYRPPAPVPPNGPKKFVPAEVPRRS